MKINKPVFISVFQKELEMRGLTLGVGKINKLIDEVEEVMDATALMSNKPREQIASGSFSAGVLFALNDFKGLRETLILSSKDGKDFNLVGRIPEDDN